jgi:hypothetical protein
VEDGLDAATSSTLSFLYGGGRGRQIGIPACPASAELLEIDFNALAEGVRKAGLGRQVVAPGNGLGPATGGALRCDQALSCRPTGSSVRSGPPRFVPPRRAERLPPRRGLEHAEAALPRTGVTSSLAGGKVLTSPRRSSPWFAEDDSAVVEPQPDADEDFFARRDGLVADAPHAGL